METEISSLEKGRTDFHTFKGNLTGTIRDVIVDCLGMTKLIFISRNIMELQGFVENDLARTLDGLAEVIQQVQTFSMQFP